jgi:ATP-dependent Clp protease protease subunit
MRLQPLTVFNYSIKNESDEIVDIDIDGYIVDTPTQEFLSKYYGDDTSTSYKSFRDKIPANVKTINLKVNSGGGHVGDAMAIHDYLLELEANGVTVNRKGIGIVASAATYLVMGKNSEMSENSWFMIHNASGFAYGDVNQVENQARALRKFNDRIVSFYAKNTGLSETVISNMMTKETWLTAQEAKEKGFVTNVGGSVEFTNSIKEDQWPFANTAVLNAYNSHIKPLNMENKILETIQNGFNSLLEKLGLKDKATDENVKNAFTEFSTAITNAVKEGGVDETKLTTLVSNAVTEAMKTLGENEAFKNAVSGYATKDDIKNMATKDDVKSIVTTEALNKALGGVKDEIVNAVNEKLGNGTGNVKKDKEKEENKNKGTRNRFSGQVLWEEEAKN